MSAGADIAAVMEPLDRMETLSRRLALHHRLIGDALDEASEIPAAANLDAVKDGLDIWVLQQEQLRELDKLVQDAHAAVREDKRATRTAPAKASDSDFAANLQEQVTQALTGMCRNDPAKLAALEGGFIGRLIPLRAAQIDDAKAELDQLQDRLDKAEAALAKHVATEAKGVLAQVSAAMGHLVHEDAEAKAALAAGDFDALAACNLDWPEKLLAQALRGLDGMAGDRTVSEDPGTVFLAVQAAFNAGEVPEADFDAAYEKVAAWQPATPLEFTRKALCLLGDGKLPERDIVDRLMEQAARLVA